MRHSLRLKASPIVNALSTLPLGTRRDRSGWCQFSRQAVVLCVDEKSHIQALERTPKRAFVQDSLSIFIAS